MKQSLAGRGISPESVFEITLLDEDGLEVSRPPLRPFVEMNLLDPGINTLKVIRPKDTKV